MTIKQQSDFITAFELTCDGTESLISFQVNNFVFADIVLLDLSFSGRQVRIDSIALQWV